jgi:hypothetical protein
VLPDFLLKKWFKVALPQSVTSLFVHKEVLHLFEKLTVCAQAHKPEKRTLKTCVVPSDLKTGQGHLHAGRLSDTDKFLFYLYIWSPFTKNLDTIVS